MLKKSSAKVLSPLRGVQKKKLGSRGRDHWKRLPSGRRSRLVRLLFKLAIVTVACGPLIVIIQNIEEARKWSRKEQLYYLHLG